ncbi:MAG: hypothetical protein HFH72_08445 [Lachnospiraceae bacterium]|nr:hypothetical protein [Lachnospiraceae bacterium]
MNERFYEYSMDDLIGKTKIIYGCFQKAREFAVRLLSENLSFDMFLFPEKNENYILPHIFNKPVIDINECFQITDAVILVSFWEYEEAKETLEKYGLADCLVKAEDLSIQIKRAENVVVYGTGGRAKRFYCDIEPFLTVQSFCDSSEKKKGREFFGKEIIGPADLSACPVGTVVIIASTYVQEIFDIVRQNGIAEECIFAIRYEAEFRVQCKESAYRNLKIKEYDLHAIVRDTNKKKSIVYGNRDMVESLLPRLEILGIYTEETVLRDGLEEDGTVYDLAFLYKKGTAVLLADPYSDKTQEALVEIGISENDMIWLWEHSSFYVSDKKRRYSAVLDPNCGHTYVVGKGKYPSFLTYSYQNQECRYEAVKILTLGGSTTSGFGAKNSSWSEKLSLLLKGHGISHVIYCGGIDAYSTSNEMIKLMRDGIWLKPDLVINYTGCNNQNRYPYKNLFLNTYQELLFKSLAGKASLDFVGNVDEVYYGIQPDISKYEYWYTQIKMIHGVCDALGIRHRAFLQPLLFNKKVFLDSDADIAVLWNAFYHRGKGRYVGVNAPLSFTAILENVENFEEEGKNFQESWLESLTDLFDQEDNVYMDYCHVYEKGNQIIADKIFDKISKEIQEIISEHGEREEIE